MKLINTKTLQIEEFFGNAAAPIYAILSHTWETEEVSYQDFVLNRAAAERKKGFLKIEHTCRRARDDGIDYAWVDTCCIDKTSSAELTEAINTMYAWYASSAVCYAFLSDLEPLKDPSHPRAPDASQLRKCRWFTRGWTLQELLAPQNVIFYDGDWQQRGTKSDLSEAIAEVTDVDRAVLLDDSLLRSLPVARKMSWAARRRTTRIEDIAYCMLGLFDVNMPMLYGEGEKAFIRLQEEIIKQSADLTIFAWKAEVGATGSVNQKYRGILASKPSEFATTGAISSFSDARFNEEFSMTNKGLKMSTRLPKVNDGANYFMSLGFTRRVEGGADMKMGIYLKRHGASVFARDMPDHLASVEQEIGGPLETVYVSKTISPAMSARIALDHRHAICFRKGFKDTGYYSPVKVVPKEFWDTSRQLFLTHGSTSFSGYVHFISRSNIMYKLGRQGFLVVFGLTETGPWASFAGAMDPEIREETKNGRTKALGDMLVNNTRDTWPMEVFSTARVPFAVEAKYTLKLTVEETVLDNESVYCIDLNSEQTWQKEQTLPGA